MNVLKVNGKMLYIYIYALSFISCLKNKNRFNFRIIYKKVQMFIAENTSAAIGRIKGEEEDGQIEEEDRDLFETTICFHRVT